MRIKNIEHRCDFVPKTRKIGAKKYKNQRHFLTIYIWKGRVIMVVKCGSLGLFGMSTYAIEI